MWRSLQSLAISSTRPEPNSVAGDGLRKGDSIASFNAQIEGFGQAHGLGQPRLVATQTDGSTADGMDDKRRLDRRRAIDGLGFQSASSSSNSGS